MPLNEPAFDLASDPRSVHEARRWVVSACRDLGRIDLAECAELGVSELVTNALLHALPPISVRVRGTVNHPRIEVRDGSMDLPRPPFSVEATGPGNALDLDAILFTFGRGLDIVANCSTAWGTSIDGTGKAVWFEPARVLVPHDLNPPTPELVYEESSTPDRARPADSLDESVAVQIRLASLPLADYVRSRRHYVELRRELRLLSLAHQDDYPLARELSEMFARFEDSFPTDLETQIRAGLANDCARVDLVVSIDPASATVIEQIIELFELADEFCRTQRLLALARSDDERRFQIWFLREFAGQARGRPPIAWQPATSLNPEPPDHGGDRR